MSQMSFHNNFSFNNLIHTHTHTTLPIIQRFVDIYKLWDKFRNNIPRQSRFTLGTKLDSLFLDILELLFIAGYLSKEQKIPILEKSRNKLDLLKFFFQISWEIKILDDKKYIALSEKLNETGRMLGGWIRGLQNKTPA